MFLSTALPCHTHGLITPLPLLYHLQILVEVFNQKHNPFDNEVLINWLEVENVEVKDLEAVNIMVGFSADDFGEDFNF